MPSEEDLAWFAGILDAEGCFGLRRHSRRKTQVLANGFFGMADERTVVRAKMIAEHLYGRPLETHTRAPTKKSKQPFFSFNMTSKKELYAFLGQMLPYIRVKRVEMLLQYDFLCRAVKKRHIGTEHDFWLCEMSRRIKGGDSSAKDAALARVRDDFAESGSEVAWLGGYTDGDGCISMARGTKTIQMSYDSADRSELEIVRGRISTLLGGVPLPPLVEYESVLSERAQWKLSLHSVDATTRLLQLLKSSLFTKKIQAQLALFVRATDDFAKRIRAVDLIQDLNNARGVREDAMSFLDSATGL